MKTTYSPSRELQIGNTASINKKISDQDVRTFADISGDRNPVHLDDEFAEKTPFKKRIAHGALSGALISAALGMLMPGPGTIYLSQTLNFKAPVYIDDEITAKLEVTAYHPDKRIAKLKTEVYNQDNRLVLEGEAVVIAPPPKT
ncbi:MAG: MaoC family dehydratase [Anaerolineales bacterium]|jgi:acyl dehydratase